MSERVLEVIQAGRLPYAEALAWQRDLAHARIEGRTGHDLLLLVEHPPVITLGRTARPEHVLRPEGVDVVEIERGGDVTFHGPGQLVGYPIFDLRRHKPDLHWYLRTLEGALIAALGGLGLKGERRRDYTGVWIEGRKIASIGIHVKQWVTWHGFALNVTTDVAHFERIVPCGIPNVEITTVARELGVARDDGALWRRSVDSVIRGFERVLGMRAVRGVPAPHASRV